MIFKNEVFELEGAPHRLLDVDHEGNTAWVIALQDDKAFPTAVSLSAVSALKPIEQAAPVRGARNLSTAEKSTRDRAVKTLWPLLGNGTRLYTEAPRYELIKKHASETGVSLPTIYKWLRMYWKNGQCEAALTPSYSRCGRTEQNITGGRGAPSSRGVKTYQVTEQDYAKFKRVLEEHYLAGDLVTLTQTYQRLLERHYSYLDGNGNAYILPPGCRPTGRQLQHFLRKTFTREHILRMRKGDSVFELKHRAIVGTVEEDCNGVGHMYECDATIADVILCASDDIQTIVGKPTIYYVVDRQSRLIVGFYVGFENPSWVCAKQALLFIAEDKEKLCQRYGIAYDPEDWPAHMVFSESVLADLGEWNTKGGEQLGHNLVTHVMFVPRKRADLKAVVETTNKQSRVTLQDGTPGYEPPENAKQRQGKNYDKDASMNLHQFTKVMLELIIKHNRTVRRGYQFSLRELDEKLIPTPINVWNRDIVRRSGALTRYSYEHVRFQLLPREKATVTAYGVLFKKCFYTSDEFIKRGTFVNARASRFSVEVAFDHRLADNIYVIDPRGDAEPTLCNLTSRSAVHRGRSFAEVAVYYKMHAHLDPLIEQHNIQTAATYHSNTQPTFDQARAALASSPKMGTRKSRKADTKAAREEERGKERASTANLSNDSNYVATDAPPALVVDLDLARKNRDLPAATKSTGSPRNANAPALVTTTQSPKPLTLLERARLARERWTDTP